MPSVIKSCIRGVIKKRRFRKDFQRFRKLSDNVDARFEIKWDDRFPCLDDLTDSTGFDRHYVYHTAWASRVLARIKPESHVDISSHIYFVALTSAFIPIRHYEFRKCDLDLSGLTSSQADLLSLPFDDDSLKSMSCMHVVEHMGLGRYGDALDPEGDLKAIEEIKRVVAPGGDLLIVVPIGEPRVAFNAHRIYSYEQLMGYFKGFENVEFALIPDNPADGSIVSMPSGKLLESQIYGCGCFWFRKEKG